MKRGGGEPHPDWLEEPYSDWFKGPHPDWLEGLVLIGQYWQTTQAAHWCFLELESSGSVLQGLRFNKNSQQKVL